MLNFNHLNAQQQWRPREVKWNLDLGKFACLEKMLAYNSAISGWERHTTASVFPHKPITPFYGWRIEAGKNWHACELLLKKNPKPTTCIRDLNIDLTELWCCPEYQTSFPCYQLWAGFLSLLERVLYFLQITKYQRTGFKKQDYCSGI